MRPPRRLEAHPLTALERGAPVTFRHEGKAVSAFGGDSVAAALYAEGRLVLSRSMRYHRARGLYCGTGGCTHCFLRVDGQPNVRSCQMTCTNETWTEGQNAWPSVDHDLLAASDVAYPRYLNAHTSFVKPRPLRRVFHYAARRMAGFGRVPRAPVPQVFRKERLEPDVLVVGAGPAGIAAAQAAREGDARVALFEAEARTGGRLRLLPTPFLHVRHEHAPGDEGKAYAEARTRDLESSGVDIRRGVRVIGAYGNRWTAAGSTVLYEVQPKRVVLAVGALDAYPMVPGADRAGVLLAHAALKLLNVHGIVPADPVVIYGATRDGLLLARDLVACGARVAGVYESQSAAPAPAALIDEVRRLGVPIQVDHRAAYVVGRKRVRAVVLDAAGSRVRVPCATLVGAGARTVLGELFQQAGAELVHEATRGGFLPVLGGTLETTVRGLYAAGSCAGVEDEWSSVLRGRIAGAAAAWSLRPDAPERRRGLDAALEAYDAVSPKPPMPSAATPTRL